MKPNLEVGQEKLKLIMMFRYVVSRFVCLPLVQFKSSPQCVKCLLICRTFSVEFSNKSAPISVNGFYK